MLICSFSPSMSSYYRPDRPRHQPSDADAWRIKREKEEVENTPSTSLYIWIWLWSTIIISILVGGLSWGGYKLLFSTPQSPSTPTRETALPAVSQPAPEVYPQ